MSKKIPNLKTLSAVAVVVSGSFLAILYTVSHYSASALPAKPALMASEAVAQAVAPQAKPATKQDAGPIRSRAPELQTEASEAPVLLQPHMMRAPAAPAPTTAHPVHPHPATAAVPSTHPAGAAATPSTPPPPPAAANAHPVHATSIQPAQPPTTTTARAPSAAPIVAAPVHTSAPPPASTARPAPPYAKPAAQSAPPTAGAPASPLSNEVLTATAPHAGVFQLRLVEAGQQRLFKPATLVQVKDKLCFLGVNCVWVGKPDLTTDMPIR